MAKKFDLKSQQQLQKMCLLNVDLYFNTIGEASLENIWASIEKPLLRQLIDNVLLHSVLKMY